MKWPSFKHPEIVKIATVLAVAVFVLLVPWPFAPEGLDKPAFELSTGFGLLYLTAASWALMRGGGNTAAYIVSLGAALIVGGYILTDSTSFDTPAVEALVPMIIGSVGTLFTIALKSSIDKDHLETE